MVHTRNSGLIPLGVCSHKYLPSLGSSYWWTVTESNKPLFPLSESAVQDLLSRKYSDGLVSSRVERLTSWRRGCLFSIPCISLMSSLAARIISCCRFLLSDCDRQVIVLVIRMAFNLPLLLAASRRCIDSPISFAGNFPLGSDALYIIDDPRFWIFGQMQVPVSRIA